jgi:hypothetical protein
MDDLAAALHARLVTLTNMPEFPAWRRSNPEFKQRLSVFLATAHGQRCTNVLRLLLDTAATHCFICARLAAVLDLLPSGQQDPTSVTTARGTLGLAAPVLIYLCLGDKFRESMSVFPMDMDVGYDLILVLDWISRHDLRHLYADGSISLQSGPAQLQLGFLPAHARAAARTLTAIRSAMGSFAYFFATTSGRALWSLTLHRCPRRPHNRQRRSASQRGG